MEPRPPSPPPVPRADPLPLLGAMLGVAAGGILVAAGAAALHFPLPGPLRVVLPPGATVELVGVFAALVGWTALWYAVASMALLRPLRRAEGMRAGWMRRSTSPRRAGAAPPTPSRRAAPSPNTCPLVSPNSGGGENLRGVARSDEGEASSDEHHPSSASLASSETTDVDSSDPPTWDVSSTTLPPSLRLGRSPGAAADAPPVVHLHAAGERFARGVLVGTSAAVDGGMWMLAGPPGWIVGGVLAMVGLASTVPAVTRRAGFEALLGWSAWLRPMAWPATGVGLLLFLLDLPFALAARGRGALRLDRRTGTVETAGGWPVEAAGFVGGFDLGGFSFLTRAAPTPFESPGLSAHETGHALNVAALGAVVHWIGAVEENVPPLRRHWRAYAELLAESHRPRPGRVVVRMWG